MYFFSVNDRKYEIVHLEISQSEAECGYAHLTVALAEDENGRGDSVGGIVDSAYGIGCVFREASNGARDVIISGDAALVPVDGGLYFVEIIARPIEQPSVKNLYQSDLYVAGASLICRNPDNDAELLSECLSASGEVLFCDMKTRQVRRSQYVGNCAEAYVLEREIGRAHV